MSKKKHILYKNKYIKIKLILINLSYIYLYVMNNIKNNSIKPNKIVNDISNIYPKINIHLKNISKLNELLTSKKLYITDTFLTNEYIRHINKLQNNYDKKLNKKNKNEVFKISKNKKLNWFDFYYICTLHKLIKPITNKEYKDPLISVIVPSYNKEDLLLSSIRSIQNQSFKNIEIIIVDDHSVDNSIEILEQLIKTDKRIRVFYHLKNMGVWRSRLDGLLYSRGKYIINFDSGDLYADNLVLEESYDLLRKYNLDSIRFSFILFRNAKNIEKKKYKNIYFNKNYTKIILGHNIYAVDNYIHGPIWNRLIKKKVLFKSLDLIDSYILNAYKNLWEDSWWNTLTNHISYRNLMINRVGYIYIKARDGEGHYKLKNEMEKDKTIHEIIYFWLFDYQLLPKEDNKDRIISKIRKYSQKNSEIINLNFLKTNFDVYKHLLNLLIKDSFVHNKDKLFLKKLLNQIE